MGKQTSKTDTNYDERFSVSNLAKSYLDYFAQRGHEVVSGAPLLPADPTLLFTAAGMVPFKAYYSDPDAAPYPRAASLQKCLRAGGKQSDLENVGRTLRHHTFFEMLGNFSFGDYFKKEAIEYAWELSTDGWGLDKEALWVSVFTDDDEAFDLWTTHIGFPKDRVVRLGKKDNFWGPVGDTGVCGPSSEMYVDTGASRGCGRPECAPGCDCDRFIEFWNLVFPQFFFTEAQAYDPLPRPGIDTGLGLERLAFILQGAPDNYHTDEFLPIRNAVAAPLDRDRRDEAAVPINVAADHVRALTFALAEGIMPSNEGRGYVLRRLLRRAVTKMQPFGVREPFLALGVDAVVSAMGGRYPELAGRADRVKEIITAEEERFFATLEQGMDRLRAIIDKSEGSADRRISGDDAFLLYDTFGFPLELTEEFAEERGLELDRDGFERAMAAQKERARQRSFHATGDDEAGAFIDVDSVEKTDFVGYEDLVCDARLGAFRVRDDGRRVEFVTDRTVFYPESGGQVGDTGAARFGDEQLDVVDTVYAGSRIAHAVDWKESPEAAAEFFAENKAATLAVDPETRMSTARNHTATHLLHAALRATLGDHVAQAGSLVAPDRLRFDFQHYHAMAPEEVAEVERIVNDAILSDMAITTERMPYKEAVAQGAMALFGEKYGDEVRVVTIEDFSKELCGGTHLSHTGEIGPFLVRHEGAVAAGVRRVEAITGKAALDHVAAVLREREALARTLGVAPGEVGSRVKALLEETEALQSRLKANERARAKGTVEDAAAGAGEVAGLKFVSTVVDAADVPSLRAYGDTLRGKLGTGVGLLCQDVETKPVVLLVVSDDAVSKRGVKANELTKRIGDALGYRGGGKPHMAQVGIPNKSDFSELENFVKVTLESMA